VTPAKLSASYAGAASAGGPATTAVALAANGTNCPAAPFAAGVDSQGDAGGCAFVLPQNLGILSSPTVADLTSTDSVSLPAGSVPASALGSSPLFGDGSGGSVSFMGPSTLLKDLYASDLNLVSGATLNTNGVHIFVRDTLTMNGTATIRNNGSNGAVVGGPGAPAGTVGGGTAGGNGAINGTGGSSTVATNALGGPSGGGGALIIVTTGSVPAGIVVTAAGSTAGSGGTAPVVAGSPGKVVVLF